MNLLLLCYKSGASFSLRPASAGLGKRAEARSKLKLSPLFYTLVLVCCLASAQAATLFLGGYPSSLLVFDEGKGAIVDRIPLTTGLPTSIRLSADRKKIYVSTNDHSRIEIVDV